LFPYLNGEDLNSDPEQKPTRWVINFFDWPEEKARSYPDCFEILERLVKPERQRPGNAMGRNKWWQFYRRGVDLYEAISKLDQVMVVPLVSKYSCFEFVPTKYVYMHKLGVLALTSFQDFALLTSTIHNAWCWKNSSTLGAGTLNYSTTDCFETFPFPADRKGDLLNALGQQYFLYRKKLMSDLQIGLTKLYNLFHDSDLLNNSLLRKYLDLSGNMDLTEVLKRIETFRMLHVKIDTLVLQSYNWDDINPVHEFYELEFLPENDRIRFSVHPNARKEILKRLVKLNLQVHATEGNKIPARIKNYSLPKAGESGTLF
jgi:hypothetical protein